MAGDLGTDSPAKINCLAFWRRTIFRLVFRTVQDRPKSPSDPRTPQERPLTGSRGPPQETRKAHSNDRPRHPNTPKTPKRQKAGRSGSTCWAPKTPPRLSQEPSEGSRGSPGALPDPSRGFQNTPGPHPPEAPRNPKSAPDSPGPPETDPKAIQGPVSPPGHFPEGLQDALGPLPKGPRERTPDPCSAA